VRIRIRRGMMMAATIVICSLTYAQTTMVRAERELFASINQARRANGLPALRWNEALGTAARRHAGIMAEHGSAQHGFPGEPNLSARAKQAGAHFGWLSENVIQGSSPEFIHEQFMKSPPHRANILDKEMDSVGIGVVEQGRQFFAVEDFSQAR